MKARLLRALILAVTVAAIAMMFFPLVEQFLSRMAEPPVTDF